MSDPLASRRDGVAGILTPVGWWYTLRVRGGNFCRLRDFPPLPRGFGASRVYCISPQYEHYWMWRVIRASGGGGAPSSGEQVYLSIYQPMYHYCMSASQVVCGVDANQATRFVIEKESGSGPINLSADTVYLRVNSSYCGLTGSGHNQQLRCIFGSRASATPFQLPASNYASVQLISQLTNNTCGGDFYAMHVNPAPVSCVEPFIGIAANLTLALQAPGAAALPAGGGVALKTYEDLYTYSVATWKVDASKRVYLDPVSTEGATQWFAILPFSASGTGAGNASTLVSGSMVALRSAATGQFCGVSSATQAAMYCDRPGPMLLLPPGYRYTFVSAPAALRPYRPLPVWDVPPPPPPPLMRAPPKPPPPAPVVHRPR